MKILLINPSYFKIYGANHAGIANPVYPIMSLAALAGAARASGHSVRILDLSYRPYDPKFLKETILKEKPDIIGMTATTPLVNQIRDLSFLIKNISKDILTVGGGSHPSALPLETLKESLLDVVVAGEGDETFLELLEGKNFKEIQGIYWRKEDQIIKNSPRPLIPYLDDLAMPAWELYPIDVYRNKITKIIARKSPMTTIEFSRGCVFKCDFCGSKQTMGMGYRKKSPERCAEEMSYLYQLGYREVLLTDDIFTSDNNWAIRVCEELIRKKVKMVWTCTNGIRVDSANLELFKMMKRAGCYRVHFGFESGSDEVLKSFGKGGRASLEQGNKAVEQARKAKLETWGMFMVGLSGDTEKTMNDTIAFAKKIKVDIKKFGITVPFPGTKMFQEFRKLGKIKSINWDKYNVYNDASPLFDHPHLSWKTILHYYKKAYVDCYYKDPAYLLRRIWRGIKTFEFYSDVYFGIRFLMLLLLKSKNKGDEAYAYQSEWEPLNLKPEDLCDYSYSKATQSSWKKNPTKLSPVTLEHRVP